MSEQEVRDAIEALFGEALTDEGADTLDRLLRELVTRPGRAQVHRAAVLDELTS